MKFCAQLSLTLLASLGLLACQASTNQPNPIKATNAPETHSHSKTIQVGKAPHGMASAQGFVYNSNSGENTIVVIDSKNDQVIHTITLPTGHPGYLKATHQEKYILATNPDSGLVYVIDPAKGHRLVHTIDVGKGPDKVEVSDDDQKVYISLTGAAEVVLLDFAKGWEQAPAIKRLATGAPSPDGQGHRSLDAQGDWLIVPNPGDNDVSLINLLSGEQSRLQDGNQPGPVALLDKLGKVNQVLVGNAASHSVTLFELESKKATSFADLGQSPTDVAVVKELGRAFITMAGSNQVAVLDFLKPQKLGSVKTDARPVHIYVAPALDDMHVTHEGAHYAAPEIWVANDTGNTVTVFDSQTLAIKATHLLGKGHHKMAFANGKAYVSNITDQTITVIERETSAHESSES